jgi:hypothetical protein
MPLGRFHLPSRVCWRFEQFKQRRHQDVKFFCDIDSTVWIGTTCILCTILYNIHVLRRFYGWDRENMHIMYNVVVHVHCTCTTCIECVVYEVWCAVTVLQCMANWEQIFAQHSALLYICSPLKLLSTQKWGVSNVMPVVVSLRCPESVVINDQ